jgi:hypothetical protein
MAAITTSGFDRVARRRAAKTLLDECALLGLTLVVMFVLVYPTAWIFIASTVSYETSSPRSPSVTPHRFIALRSKR